jgi:hypothetical protein
MNPTGGISHVIERAYKKEVYPKKPYKWQCPHKNIINVISCQKNGKKTLHTP